MVRNYLPNHNNRAGSQGHLLSRPTTPIEPAPFGLYPLRLDGDRDGLIYAPDTYQADQPTSLVLMLHGAGGNAEGATSILQDWADAFGTVILAVDSRQTTWDAIRGKYGPDIAFIDRALKHAFNHYAINPNRVAIAGFSDGASYALSVGVMNGDLFTHIIAFSPGFMAPDSYEGKPHLFISHGTWDTVLSINRCSRQIVPNLQQAGYDVQYHEFNGLHTVPQTIARKAMQWFTEKQ